MSPHPLRLVALTAALSAGCTFTPGGGFGTLGEATFAAAFEPGARDLGDGGALTDLLYRVRLDSATLSAGDLVLAELSGGGGASFDPAQPPPGYTLCHGGHCHSEDGALVDYADIEAELAGGAASFVPVLTFPLGGDLDLLAGRVLDLAPVEDGALLPAAEVSKATLDVTRIRLAGSVSGGPEGSGIGEIGVPLAVDLAVSGQVGAGLEMPIARDEDPIIDLSVRLVVDGAVFDGIDFAPLSASGEVRLDSIDEEAAAALAAALLASGLEFELERSR